MVSCQPGGTRPGARSASGARTNRRSPRSRCGTSSRRTARSGSVAASTDRAAASRSTEIRCRPNTQQVEVEFARAPATAAPPARGPFERLEPAEQPQRGGLRRGGELGGRRRRRRSGTRAGRSRPTARSRTDAGHRADPDRRAGHRSSARRRPGSRRRPRRSPRGRGRRGRIAGCPSRATLLSAHGCPAHDVTNVDVVILHAEAPADGGPLTRATAAARRGRRGAPRARVPGRRRDHGAHRGGPAGRATVRRTAAATRRRISATAGSSCWARGRSPSPRPAIDVISSTWPPPDRPRALTNNRYSADVVAIARARIALADLPDLAADNALPRWLAEVRRHPGRRTGAAGRASGSTSTARSISCCSAAVPAPGCRRARRRPRRGRLARVRALTRDPARRARRRGPGVGREPALAGSAHRVADARAHRGARPAHPAGADNGPPPRSSGCPARARRAGGPRPAPRPARRRGDRRQSRPARPPVRCGRARLAGARGPLRIRPAAPRADRRPVAARADRARPPKPRSRSSSAATRSSVRGCAWPSPRRRLGVSAFRPGAAPRRPPGPRRRRRGRRPRRADPRRDPSGTARCRSPGSWSSRCTTREAATTARPTPVPAVAGDFLTAPELHPIFGEALAVAIDRGLGRPRARPSRSSCASTAPARARWRPPILGWRGGPTARGRAALPGRSRSTRAGWRPCATGSARRGLGDRLDDRHGRALRRRRHRQRGPRRAAGPPGPPAGRRPARAGRRRSTRTARSPRSRSSRRTGALARRLADDGVDLVDGQTAEICLALDAWVADGGGAAPARRPLLIDYGAPAAELYDPVRRRDGTLRAYVRHQVHDDPYRFVGRQDLTAHVDVTAVERAARGGRPDHGRDHHPGRGAHGARHRGAPAGHPGRSGHDDGGLHARSARRSCACSIRRPWAGSG